MVTRHKCEKFGCDEDGVLCSLNDDEDTEFYYCPTHCFEEGFCFGCGNFFSGIEDFDFEPSHLCANCRTEVEEEDEEIPCDSELGEPWDFER